MWLAVVTLKDVASKSGVSIATASLVLNGKGNISTDVRERVMKSAKTLGYLKNIHASSTASRKSRHVAILVDESYEKAFEWLLIRSILIPLEATLTEKQYYPILIPVTRSQTTSQIVDKVVMSGAGALFAIHFGDAELFRQLEDRNISVVILNHSRASQDYYSVTDDFSYGTFESTNFLLANGHRRLVFVDYDRPDLPGVVFDRNAGFEKSISQFDGIVEHRRITISSVQDNEEIESVARTLQGLCASRPLAVTAHDDFLAARLVAVLRQCGVAVPENLSVVSPGDTMDYSLPFIPQITTYRTDFELMGKLAGEMLLRRFAGESRTIESLKVHSIRMDRGSVRMVSG